MKNKIKVVIADDHPLFLEGLYLLLEKPDLIDIVGEASNGKQLLALVAQTKPDIVITDIQMPELDGIEVTQELKKIHPEIDVIGLTMFPDENMIMKMIEAGAKGYLLKSTSSEELIAATVAVYEGKNYYCNETTMRLTQMIAKTNSNTNHNEDVLFSEKETEIIKLICEQHASKEIAEKMNLRHRTVEKYRDHIMNKIGARNVVGIVVYAIRNGIYKT